MPRRARIVLPGFPHHVVQRGNRRQPVFFRSTDYSLYHSLLREKCRAANVACWAYCLMPNHVHLVLCPSDRAGLARAMRDVQQLYTMRINRREDWSGFLWQGRFYSCAMDEDHALAAVRYVERNPIDAGLCRQPEDWAWSSYRHHTGLETDPLLSTPDFLSRVRNWRGFVQQGLDPAAVARIGQYTRNGVPLGSPAWLSARQAECGQRFEMPKRGRPATAQPEGDRYN